MTQEDQQDLHRQLLNLPLHSRYTYHSSIIIILVIATIVNINIIINKSITIILVIVTIVNINIIINKSITIQLMISALSQRPSSRVSFFK